jgi:hypothetical protein
VVVLVVVEDLTVEEVEVTGSGTKTHCCWMNSVVTTSSL